MDLQDATLRVFNTELLEFGGILLRLTLDHAFGVLDEEWQQSSVEREALDKRLESESKVAKDEEAVASGSDDKDETDTKSSKSLMKFARFMARYVRLDDVVVLVEMTRALTLLVAVASRRSLCRLASLLAT